MLGLVDKMILILEMKLQMSLNPKLNKAILPLGVPMAHLE
jgi:hypothetical protein